MGVAPVELTQPMTPELTKEIIIDSLSVFFTALFAGLPGAALFWWTYQRDQERLIVEKTRPRGTSFDGKQVLAKDNLGPIYGIVIRNRSLFPVHVSAVGFEIDGEVIQAEHPDLPLKLKRNPDPYSDKPNIPDENANPLEIPSQAAILVSLFNPVDRKKFSAALFKAAKRHDVTPEAILNGPRMIAMVATETGKIFTSLPFRKRVYRWLVRVRKEMDGNPSAADEQV